MDSIRKALIVAACTTVSVAGYTAYAQDAASPGAPTHPSAADHAQQPTDGAHAGHDGHAGDAKKAKGDIIDVATGADMSNVTTLVAAIKAAGLVETLKGPGPFTVFAPTNEAFAKLPPGTVEDLLKPENKEKLKELLLCHVHSGKAVKAADVKTMKLSTAGGKDVNVKVNGSTVMVNNAKVIKTDVMASNGIIHQVDAVIMPEKKAGAMGE